MPSGGERWAWLPRSGSPRLANWAATSRAAGGTSGDLLPLVITGSLLSIIPLAAAFLMLQRFWQSGLGAGGVKQ
jgi:multiple sugar transport system permease protein